MTMIMTSASLERKRRTVVTTLVKITIALDFGYLLTLDTLEIIDIMNVVNTGLLQRQ